jgi:hypothetical protein
MLLAKVFISIILCCVAIAVLIAGRNEPYKKPEGVVSYEEPRTNIDLFMQRFGAETIRVFFFRQDGQWRAGAKPALISFCFAIIALIWLIV